VKADIAQHILEQEKQRAVIQVGVGPNGGVDLPRGSRSVATNSISGATTTVPYSWRVMELRRSW